MDDILVLMLSLTTRQQGGLSQLVSNALTFHRQRYIDHIPRLTTLHHLVNGAR